METSNTEVFRTTKNISTLVTLSDGKEFIMCGEIINDEIDIKSIGVTYYQSKEFDKLSEEDAEKVKSATLKEFRRFC